MPAATYTLAAAVEAAKNYPIILVTGGSGYIGSHTVLEILKAGCAVVVIDNLGNSHLEALIRVYHIAKEEYTRLQLDPETVPPLFFHKVDLCDKKAVFSVFQLWQTASPPFELLKQRKLEVVDIKSQAASQSYRMLDYELKKRQRAQLVDRSAANYLKGGKIAAVVHFAALKSVGESVANPLRYYQNNIGGLLNLLEAMAQYEIDRMVFSSSAVVYGEGKEANISEDSVQVGGKGTGGGLVTNPYGRSKWIAEEVLNDCCVAYPQFKMTSLRYFNPTGSHPSGLIGEDPKGVPNNIVPVILQTFQRRRSKVYVYGSSYDTSDGTGVRDYIHVTDLAQGHVAALRSLLTPADRRKSIITAEDTGAMPNYRVYNLGTGHGYSVLDIIKAFAKISGVEIPFAISDARPGDLGTVTASTSKAETELGWQAEFDIQDMCRDVYAFASENPLGYERLRRFSTLALKDPLAFRKVSTTMGLDSGLAGMVESFANLAADRVSFNEVVRRLSTISDGIKTELRKESIADVGPPAERFGTSPRWSVFGDSWHDDNLPHRGSDLKTSEVQ